MQRFTQKQSPQKGDFFINMARSVEARRQAVSEQIVAFSVDQLGADKRLSGKDLNMNGRDVAWIAGRELLGNGFKGMDKTARNGKNGNSSSGNLINRTETLETSELTTEQTAMGMLLGDLPQDVELTLPKTKTKATVQKAMEPSLHEEKRGVRLDGFLPENGQEVDEGKLVAEFFGYGRRWRAAYSNPDSFKAREDTRERRILGENPDKKAELEYREKRARQIDDSDRHAARSINTRFRRAWAEYFDKSEKDSMDDAEEHLDHAADAQRYALRTLFGQRGAVSQRNESVLPILDPNKVVEVMSSDNSSLTLKLETRKRFERAFISADISTFNRSREARRKLTMIQDLLNEKLFSGMTASTVNITIRAIFDDVTNAINFVEGVDGKIPDDSELPEHTHIKTKVLPMRAIQGTGLLVYTNPSEKTQASSIMKAMKKALVSKEEGRGELIAGAEEVQDINRIMFAVFGNENDRDALIDTVFNILVENQHRLAERDIEGRPILPRSGDVIQDIIPDDKTDGRPGQSENYRSRRIQLLINGQKIEIKFQTMEEFLEGEYEVGVFDKKKNKFTGAAHGLYEIQRLIDLLPYIIPQSLHKKINLKKEATKTLKAKAEELKAKR